MDENKKTALLREDVQKIQQALVQGALAGASLEKALKKAEKSTKAVAATASRVKRILAGFDEINRLGEKVKSGSSKKKSTAKKQEEKEEEQTAQPETQPVQKKEPAAPESLPAVEVPDLQMFVNGGLNLEWVAEKVGQVGTAVEGLWQNTLTPMSQWFSDGLLPGIGRLLTEGVDAGKEKVTEFGGKLSELWDNFTQGLGGIFQTVIPGLQQLDGTFDAMAGNVSNGSSRISSATDAMGQSVSGTATGLQTVLQGLQSGWNGTMGQLQTGTASVSTGVTGALGRITDFLQGSFSGAWASGFAGLENPAKSSFNGIIGFVNKMVSGLGGALNGVVNAANKLKFTVPDWVPGIGGKQYGFSLKTISIPQVPYLAKGAVLPANQPFLAVVGDQRHGTNVEAPLSTIQEAVAGVMADHTAGNMAGHEATVQMLERILEAVLGIDVGEAVIARAAQNYRLKNAVMKGGGF